MGQPKDYAQRLLALDTTASMMIVAPAGSGKTSTLAARYLALLAVCERPENVLATTFTNKAANELRDRIIDLLRRGRDETPPEKSHDQEMWDLARAVLRRDDECNWNLIENPSRLRAMTIDKFNALQAAKLPVMSGLAGGAAVDENPESLYREAVLATLAELESPGLSDEYRVALQEVLAFGFNRAETLVPILSEMLARRDQWLLDVGSAEVNLTAADGVLVRMCDEALRAALDALNALDGNSLMGVLRKASSHHEDLAWAASLPAQLPGCGGEDLPVWRRLAGVLLKKTDRALRSKVTAKEGFPAKLPSTTAMNDWLKAADGDVRLEAALAAVIMLPDATYPESSARFREHLMQVLRRLVANLSVVFSQRGSVDFCEVSLRALASLGSRQSDADAISDAALDADDIHHILVDEAQDTSLSQYELLGRLVAEWEPGDGRTITFAGDPMQSIYYWRGANVSSFVQILQDEAFAGIPLEIVRLSCNFRSEAGVVDWFNNAFTQVFPREANALVGQVPFAPSDAEINDPARPGIVEVHPFAGAQPLAEATKVVELVQQAIDADPESKGSIAILVRGRTHLTRIIPALKAAGISFSGQDIDPLVSRPAVSNLVALTRALWHPADRTAWMTVLRSPWCGFSWADCVAVSRGRLKTAVRDALALPDVQAELSDLARATARLLLEVVLKAENDAYLRSDFAARVRAVWLAMGGPSSVSVSDTDDVETYFNVLRAQCAGGPLHDIESFELALGKLYASPGHGRVTLMTLHKAKGLEFDTVIIPGLGRLPMRDSDPLMLANRFPEGFFIAPNPGKLAEKDGPEWRLFGCLRDIRKRTSQQEMLRLVYVGITRAARTLHLVGWAEGKTGELRPGSGTMLEILWPAIAEQFAGLEVVSEGDAAPRIEVPRATRFTEPFVLPEIQNAFDPVSSRNFLPTEGALTGEAGADRRSLAERAAGTVFHQLVRRFAHDGVEAWDGERLQRLKGGIAAQLRSHGCPEPAVPEMVGRVVRLAENTLESDIGRWVLRKRPESECEMCLSGRHNGAVVTRYLDIAFPDGDDHWIVDYKTAGLSVKPEEVDAFVTGQVALYREKMEHYRDLLRASGVSRNIRLALYLPAVGRLAEVQ